MSENNQSTEMLAVSERFTSQILKEFGGNVAGACPVTEHQRALIQGYFIAIDRALAVAEQNRINKNKNNTNHDYDNTLPVVWNNVNLTDLAIDLMHYAKLGLDMQEENMLFAVPYKNNKRGLYDVVLMEGYNGIRLIAERYAIEKPKNMAVEVVYSTDKFRVFKKDASHRTEGYEFEITDPFARGNIVGGFAFMEFDDPAKNRVIVMSMNDIKKRKPTNASPEFWGGKKSVWENGKKTEVELEGWLDEMVRKTIIREAYSAKHLPRDPQKVDDAYRRMQARELEYARIAAADEIKQMANTIDVNPDTGEVEAPIVLNLGEAAKAAAENPDF